MKRHITTLLVGLVCLMAAAQQPQGQRPERPSMTLEEFQTKQKEFIAQQAGLTEEESDAFFPLYFELQNKKHELNGRVWKKARAVHPNERTEAYYAARPCERCVAFCARKAQELLHEQA